MQKTKAVKRISLFMVVMMFLTILNVPVVGYGAETNGSTPITLDPGYSSEVALTSGESKAFTFEAASGERISIKGGSFEIVLSDGDPDSCRLIKDEQSGAETFIIKKTGTHTLNVSNPNDNQETETLEVKKLDSVDIALSAASKEIKAGKPAFLSADWTAELAEEQISWESSDKDVVQVFEGEKGDAMLIPESTGTAEIQVTMGSKSAICQVTVLSKYDQITLPYEEENCTLENEELFYTFEVETPGTVSVKYENAGKDLYFTMKRIQDGESVDYTYDEDAKANIFRVTQSGNYTLDMAYVGEGSVSDTLRITTEPFKGIELSHKSRQMEVSTERIIDIAWPEDYKRKDVTWSSSDASVVSVENYNDEESVTAAKLTGIKEGEATITAAAGGKTGTCQVTVKESYRTNLAAVSGQEQTLTTEDTGYYYFDAEKGQKVTITMDSGVNQGELCYLDSKKEEQEFSDSYDGKPGKIEVFITESGRYYVEAAKFAAGEFRYTLTLNQEEADDLVLEYDYEPMEEGQEITIEAGKTEDLYIAYCKDEPSKITCESEKPDIAIAACDGESIQILAREAGTTDILVKTASGTQKTVKVTVEDIYDDPDFTGAKHFDENETLHGYKILDAGQNLKPGQQIDIAYCLSNDFGMVSVYLLGPNKGIIELDYDWEKADQKGDGWRVFKTIRVEEEGSYYLRVEKDDMGEDYSLDYTLDVTLGALSEQILLSDEGSLIDNGELDVGTKTKLDVKYIPASAEGELKWSSDRPSFVAVDETSGEITAMQETSDPVTITATKGSAAGSYEIQKVCDYYKDAAMLENGLKEGTFAAEERANYYKIQPSSDARNISIGLNEEKTDLSFGDSIQLLLFNTSKELIEGYTYTYDDAWESIRLTIPPAAQGGGMYYLKVSRANEYNVYQDSLNYGLDVSIEDTKSGFTLDQNQISVETGKTATVKIAWISEDLAARLSQAKWSQVDEEGNILGEGDSWCKIAVSDGGRTASITVEEGWGTLLGAVDIGGYRQTFKLDITRYDPVKYTNKDILGGSIYFDPKTGMITSVDGSVMALTTPEKIKGTPVKGLALYVGNTFLKEVHISENIEELQIYAGNISLKSTLETITVDDKNEKFTAIDNVLFAKENGNPDKLLFYPNRIKETNYTVPQTITKIGEYAICNDTLEEITIPESAAEIEEGAFCCPALKTITLTGDNQNFETDAQNALYSKETKTLIKYPSAKDDASGFTAKAGTKRIGDYAFNSSKNLTEINLPDTLTEIGIGAFYNCEKLESVEIPVGVTELEEYTFSGCSQLSEVKLPEGLKSIGFSAFNGCKKLKKIQIPRSVINIEGMVFGEKANLTIVGHAGSYAEEYADDHGYGFEAILATDLSACTATLSSSTYTYNGKVKTPAVIVKDAGKTLEKDTDYTVNYKNNVNAGTATVTITGKGDYRGTITKTFIIKKIGQSISGSSSFTKAYGSKTFSLGCKAKGKLSYKTSNAKVVTVSSAGKVTIKGTGKATITVTAAAATNYNKAVKGVNITVTPKKVAGIKAKAGKKQIAVSWGKDTKATGYQILYSTNSKFKKGNKTINVTTYKTTKKTIKKLKDNAAYYVKVRAYKKVGKQKIYGSYSSVTKIKTKK